MGFYDEALAKSLETGDSTDLGRVFTGDLEKAHIKAHFRLNSKTGKREFIKDYDDARHKDEVHASFHKDHNVKVNYPKSKHHGKTMHVSGYSEKYDVVRGRIEGEKHPVDFHADHLAHHDAKAEEKAEPKAVEKLIGNIHLIPTDELNKLLPVLAQMNDPDKALAPFISQAAQELQRREGDKAKKAEPKAEEKPKADKSADHALAGDDGEKMAHRDFVKRDQPDDATKAKVAADSKKPDPKAEEKKPDAKPAEEKPEPKTEEKKPEPKITSLTLAKLKTILSDEFHSNYSGYSAADGVFKFKRSYFYRHGSSADKYAASIEASIKKLSEKLGIKLEPKIIDASDSWAAWPKTSYFKASIAIDFEDATPKKATTPGGDHKKLASGLFGSRKVSREITRDGVTQATSWSGRGGYAGADFVGAAANKALGWGWEKVDQKDSSNPDGSVVGGGTHYRSPDGKHTLTVHSSYGRTSDENRYSVELRTAPDAEKPAEKDSKKS
jgi:hypothetical protein